MKQFNTKPLETIKEENERPKSAKQQKSKPQKYIDKHNDLDKKHKGIKKDLKNYKTDNESDAHGGFNNFVKVNDKIGVIKPREDKKDRTANKDFNTIFVSSLLEICGEKTIDSGKEQTNIYVDLAKNDLFDEIEHMFEQYNICFTPNGLQQMMTKLNQLSENEQTVFKYFLFTNLLSNNDFWDKSKPVLDSSVICKFLSNNFNKEKELSFVSRWLCKIFLLQMFDRKPDNVVVVEDKDGKIDIREIDFDDNQITNQDGDKGFASNIFFKFISPKKSFETDMRSKWHNRLQSLKKHYDTIITKNKSIKKSFAKMIKNYTMKPQKIEELIKKTALKAKYMGLSKQEVIDGINEKIKLWKEMLKDKENGGVVNQIKGINKARKQTLKALKQITKEKVAEIVHKIMMMHDLVYDKPDERKIKDNNDLLNEDKTNEDIASKACNMVKEEQKRIINRIKKEREAQEKQNAERIKRDYKEIKVGGNVPMKFTKVNFNKIKEIIEEANKKKNKNKTQNKKSKKNTKTLNQGNKKGF